jgi:hypothetical protein
MAYYKFLRPTTQQYLPFSAMTIRHFRHALQESSNSCYNNRTNGYIELQLREEFYHVEIK